MTIRIFRSWRDWSAVEPALRADLSPHVVELIAKAWKFAIQWHENQIRPTGEPYSLHLLETLEIVFTVARERGGDVLVAAILHDVVEDTRCDLAEIENYFGSDVGNLVAWLTKPEARPGKDIGTERKRYLQTFSRAPRNVLLIKLADRYSNVQRLHTHPRIRKQRSYYQETVDYLLPLAGQISKYKELFTTWAHMYRYLAVPRVDTFDAVRALATVLHHGQTDKSGVPYIKHPVAVAELVIRDGGGKYQQMAALLHDTVEDTVCTFEQLRDLGVPQGVVTIVDALTHREGEPQADYLRRVNACPGAALVKRADVMHNSSHERLSRLDSLTQQRLQRKYARALAMLR